MKTKLIVTILVAAVPDAFGQLYLMTGSPTPKRNQAFASALFEVEEDGRVHHVADLATRTEWITISYDLRKIVLLDDHVTVVDFDKAAVVKNCQPPPAVDQWLVDAPGGGPVLAQNLFNLDPGNSQIRGMSLDPAVPCGESFTSMDPADLKYVLAHGRSGISDTGSVDGITVGVSQSGEITRKTAGTTSAFGYTIPSAMRVGLNQPSSRVLVNSSHIMAIGMFEKGGGHRVLALRKSDSTWHRISLPSERVLTSEGSTPIPWMVEFGDFLAIAEARTKNDRARESAGRAEWRKTESKMGPSVRNRFDEEEFAFPGRLYLYDINKDKVYTIETNQGDSEILLVDNNTVFYRASDRLYAVDILGDALQPARLLATSDIVRDAHWAFAGH